MICCHKCKRVTSGQELQNEEALSICTKKRKNQMGCKLVRDRIKTWKVINKLKNVICTHFEESKFIIKN